MVPLIVPSETPVARSIRRFTVKLPVAPANRPVPPVMVYISTIETTLGFSVGVPCPNPSANRLEPSAATRVADVVPAEVGGIPRAGRIQSKCWEGHYMGFNCLQGAFHKQLPPCCGSAQSSRASLLDVGGLS